VFLVVRCECGKESQTRVENAGRRARCPSCQREFIVPEPTSAPELQFGPLQDFSPPKTTGKAIASALLGISSVFACLFTGLPAILFGILALADIANPRKHVRGTGLAITGILLGSFTSLIWLFLPPWSGAGRAAERAQCMNNLKQIALAMQNYESEYGCFPPFATYDVNGKPLLSWRVLILPFLEQSDLYRQFQQDEPWDSPQNKPLVDKMPNSFRCPTEKRTDGLTTYEVVVDPHSMFTGQRSGVLLSSVTDGTANTFLVVESAEPVVWSKPDDIPLRLKGPPMLGLGSKHPGGFNAAMVDASVRFIKNSLRRETLEELVTRDGNEGHREQW
jgi:hypothetical protein